MARKPKTNPKGLNPSRTYKTVKKKTVGNTKAIIIVNGKSVSKAKSDAAKKGWAARRKTNSKKTTTRKKKK